MKNESIQSPKWESTAINIRDAPPCIAALHVSRFNSVLRITETIANHPIFTLTPTPIPVISK